MANPFYSFASRFVPGTLAKAADVNAQFDALAGAFDNVDLQFGLRAPLASPNFSGTPTLAGVALATVSSTVAAANAVPWTGVSGRPTNLSQFTNDSGYITSAALQWANISGRPANVSAFSNDAGYLTAAALAPYAPLASPNFSGTPALGGAPLATQAYVAAAIAGIGAGVISFNGRAGAVSLASGDVTGALGFTPYNATNPSGYITAASLAWGNISGRPTDLSSFTNGPGYVTSAALGAYAPIDSPQFTGTPVSTSGVSQIGSSSGSYVRINYAGQISFNGGAYYTLWNSNNFNPGSYLPLSGGNITGSLYAAGTISSGNSISAGGLLYGRGGGAGLGQITVSTSAPSGGADGDLWFQYS